MKHRYILLCLLLFSCISCDFGVQQALWRPHPVDERSTEIVRLSSAEFPFTGTALPEKYDCLILTDIHFGNKRNPSWQKAFFSSLHKYRQTHTAPLLFCIILGDVADHGFAEEYETATAFQQRIADENRLPAEYGAIALPIYNVVGNHDLYNSGWHLWQQHNYPHKSTYYFETNRLGWYFIDTASGTLGRPQFYDLQAKLQASSKPKFIFTHYPLYGNGIIYFSLSDPRERASLISLFAQTNVQLYCSGHYHPGAYYDYAGFQEYTVKSFGAFGKYHILHIDESGAKPVYSIETISLP